MELVIYTGLFISVVWITVISQSVSGKNVLNEKMKKQNIKNMLKSELLKADR